MELAGGKSFSCPRIRVGLGGGNPREEEVSSPTNGAREHHIATPVPRSRHCSGRRPLTAASPQDRSDDDSPSQALQVTSRLSNFLSLVIPAPARRCGHCHRLHFTDKKSEVQRNEVTVSVQIHAVSQSPQAGAFVPRPGLVNSPGLLSVLTCQAAFIVEVIYCADS